MIDYEVQQVYIKDISWLAQKKVEVMERDERNKRWQEQRAAQKEIRKKQVDERKAREDQYKQMEAEKLRIREEKQREWEAKQLAKLEEHPYQAEIDKCEHLIYFCAKNRTDLKSKESDTPNENSAEADVTRVKGVEEKLKQGKL